MENGPQPEFTLYPDPAITAQFHTFGERIGYTMRQRGIVPVLERTRHELHDNPLGERIGELRRFFDEGLGAHDRTGEAFEDGALAASLMITTTPNARLQPMVTDKIDAFLEGCEAHYYGQPAAKVTFSETRKEFIRALQDEGMKGYLEFNSQITPIAAGITVGKYKGNADHHMAVGQGIGFMLNQLKWAYEDDYRTFADRMAKTERSPYVRGAVIEELAFKALEFARLSTKKAL